MSLPRFAICVALLLLLHGSAQATRAKVKVNPRRPSRAATSFGGRAGVDHRGRPYQVKKWLLPASARAKQEAQRLLGLRYYKYQLYSAVVEVVDGFDARGKPRLERTATFTIVPKHDAIDQTGPYMGQGPRARLQFSVPLKGETVSKRSIEETLAAQKSIEGLVVRAR